MFTSRQQGGFTTKQHLPRTGQICAGLIECKVVKCLEDLFMFRPWSRCIEDESSNESIDDIFCIWTTDLAEGIETHRLARGDCPSGNAGLNSQTVTPGSEIWITGGLFQDPCMMLP